LALERGIFGITGVALLAALGFAGERYIVGGVELKAGVRTSLADLAEPNPVSAQVTEPAHAAEVVESAQPPEEIIELRKEEKRNRPAAEESISELPTSDLERLSNGSDRLSEKQPEATTEEEPTNEASKEILPQRGLAVNSAVGNQSAELEELRVAKRTLELQQNYLLDQVVKYKRQIQTLSSQTASRTDTQVETAQANEDAAQTAALKRSLESEKSRTEELALKLLELEKQLAEGVTKDQKVGDNLKKVADYAVALKKELQETKEALTKRETQIEELKGQATQLTGRVTDKMKQEAELQTLKSRFETVSKQLASEIKHRTELESSLTRTSESLTQVELQKGQIVGELDKVRQAYSAAQGEFQETKKRLDKSVEELAKLQQTSKEQGERLARVDLLEKTLVEAKTEISKRQTEIESLSAKNRDQEELLSKLPELRREIVATKNQLLMKEQELQMLSRNDRGAASSQASQAARQDTAPRAAISTDALDRHMEQSGRVAGIEAIKGRPPVSEAPKVADAMVVEVNVARAALRSGPSPDDSELMNVAHGSRLVVEERKGDWYRVIAPNSTRAYIRADLVRVVDGSSPAPDSGAPVTRVRPAERVQEDIPAAPRTPKKRPLQVNPPAGMEPFGEIKGGVPAQSGASAAPAAPTAPADGVDRAFERLRRGVGSKPVVPGMIEEPKSITE